jgi:voltage-gated potassium channel
VANPLLALWIRIFTDAGDERGDGRDHSDTMPGAVQPQESATIFLILRRMRVPLIVVIVVFAVSVLGLTLIPGRDDLGNPVRMSFLDAFYFMSFTATTIGFGEIPHSFTEAQRMWVTVAIFLSVIGWAYAVGALFALMQDRAFRRALARGHTARKIAHLREPFVLIVGYGNAAKRVARSIDDMGRRFVVIDHDENRIAGVDLDSYRADTPALLGDARDTGRLAMAGLGHRRCEAVVALSGDDEVNLDVAITTALLRPEVPVIARASSRAVSERMSAFGDPVVVNPFDRFGDHLRILLRSPASYQLMIWLTSAPGTPLPKRQTRLPDGPWLVCGEPSVVDELAEDLVAEGVDLTTVSSGTAATGPDSPVGASTLESADIAEAAVFVAATKSDTTNLWLVEAARRLHPDIFVVAMQNRAANGPLFQALGASFTVVPDEIVAHEVLARLANPVLMRFLPQVPRQGEPWASELLDRLVRHCGAGAPDLWWVRLDRAEAPALGPWLAAGAVRLEDLMRSPVGRDEPLDMVPLVLLRAGSATVTPAADEVLEAEDQLLVAGSAAARRTLDATLAHEPTAAYVVSGRVVPSSWVWRRLSRRVDEVPSERV